MTSVKMIPKIVLNLAVVFAVLVGGMGWWIPAKANAGEPENGLVNLPIVFGVPLTCADIDPGYSDDFSDPDSGWPIIDVEEVRTKYLDGQYNIIPKEFVVNTFLAPTGARNEYSVEADVRLIEARDTSSASSGLLFGVVPDENIYYGFGIAPHLNPNNTFGGPVYAVIRVDFDTGTFTEVIPTTISYEILTNEQTNHLKVVLDGTEVDLFINGTHVRTYNDSELQAPSQVGLFMVADDNSPAEDGKAWIDNFVLDPCLND